MLLLVSLLIVVLLGLLLLLLHLHQRKTALDIPGPKPLPFVLNLWEVLANRNRVPDYLVELTHKYGKTWYFRIPLGDTNVITADPACAEYILKTNFKNYVKGPQFKEKLQSLLGDGIFNSDGEMWKEQRQIASHLFKVKELKDMMVVFEKHGREVLHLLHAASDTQIVLNIADIFFRFTLDSIGEIAFGHNIDSLHKQVPFSAAFDDAQQSAVDRFFEPTWKISPELGFKKSLKVLNQFALKVIGERRASGTEGRKDLLSRYLQMEMKKADDNYLRDVILNFMIAGRDTTAQTLAWAVYLLAQNPDKEAELLKEIDRVSEGLPDGALPSYDDFKQMKYLLGVINETLRLYPPVPSDPKMALEDDVLPNGYKIKAGAHVVWNAYVMGRMEEYWKDALKFLPERWLDPEQHKARHAFLFIPFQAGPRTCLGQNMAYLEAKMLLFMILRDYTIRLRPGHSPVTYRRSLTLPMKDGLHVLISHRKQPQSTTTTNTKA
jgi:cytochrome P450